MDDTIMMDDTITSIPFEQPKHSVPNLVVEEAQSPPYEESMYINSPAYTAISIASPTCQQLD
jgi:hypothetical protein